MAAALVAGPALHAQAVPLEPVVVTAARAPEPPEQIAFSVTALDASALRAAPALTVDDALRADPGFSLFRRNDSLTANPTTQGVSLRGLGPSGASRSLVLLDGVPLNDPFGGWVAWSLVPRAALERAEIVPGGGAAAWGNAALAGVIQLLTDEPAGTRYGRLDAQAGDFGTREADLALDEPVGSGTLQIFGNDFSTDGVRLVAPESRGPIDVPASSRHRSLEARWRQALGSGLEATLTVRNFEEHRNNGTPFQQNGSRQHFASVDLAGPPGGEFAWSAVAYAQSQAFAQTFSSVNAARTAETPASIQFAVPSTAAGASWTGAWSLPGGGRTSFGGDVREVRGETREDYSFVNGAFADQRFAGGQQVIAGLFANHEATLLPGLRAEIGARLDEARNSDGHRRETVMATGVLLRNDLDPGRSEWNLSPSAGLVWQADESLRLRAAAQRGFRVPTLNELYRPFRQGANITEANPNLKTEHATSGELGADWRQGTLDFSLAGFWNDLRNAVDNVTLATGPGSFPLFGTIAAGGSGLQRLNLDEVRVAGAELAATWHPAETMTVTAGYLYDDTDVLRASVAPALVGRQLAEVPRGTATLGASWAACHSITLTPRVRWIGSQFDDDQNQLRLAAAVVADLGAELRLTRQVSLFLTVENLGNARVETARSSTGVVNVGTPRLATGSVHCQW